MNDTWHIGVIGGSGLAAGIGLDDAQEIEVASPFGLPSAAVSTGTLEGVRFTFLPRHGAGHAVPPSAVNYRANIDVLKRCGVTDLVALSEALFEAGALPGYVVIASPAVDNSQVQLLRRDLAAFGNTADAGVFLKKLGYEGLGPATEQAMKRLDPYLNATEMSLK